MVFKPTVMDLSSLSLDEILVETPTGAEIKLLVLFFFSHNDH